jgi:hypothetical protein
MVLHIFCIFGEAISHPLNALVYFLVYYGNINWSDVVITLGKPLSPIDMTETPFSSIFTSPEVAEAVRRTEQRCAETTTSEMQKISALISNYRLRYEATIAASQRAKVDDSTEVPTPEETANVVDSEPLPGVSSHADEPNASNSLPAWGMAAARPSLTTHYIPAIPSGAMLIS